jgi:hypothetical protein
MTVSRVTVGSLIGLARFLPPRWVMARCETKAKLVEDVQHSLADLIHLSHRASEAITVEAAGTVAAIDRLIELTFGRQERAMGALTQHMKDHGC